MKNLLFVFILFCFNLKGQDTTRYSLVYMNDRPTFCDTVKVIALIVTDTLVGHTKTVFLYVEKKGKIYGFSTKLIESEIFFNKMLVNKNSTLYIEIPRKYVLQYWETKF